MCVGEVGCVDRLKWVGVNGRLNPLEIKLLIWGLGLALQWLTCGAGVTMPYLLHKIQNSKGNIALLFFIWSSNHKINTICEKVLNSIKKKIMAKSVSVIVFFGNVFHPTNIQNHSVSE